MLRRSQYLAPPLAALAVVACLAAPARAQAPADPNPGNLTFVGGMDFTNAYMFRGIRQDSTGLIMQPYGEIDIGVRAADAGLKSVSLTIGTWNSLHTGDAGLQSDKSGLGCACGKLWYESDFYATLALGFSKAAFGATYTAYTSPSAGFNNVKEIMFKLTGDDSAALGRAAMHPYALVALEIDADNGHQADGGSKAGKYLELGVAPGYSGAKAGIAIPVKVGLSLGDYYELNVGTAALPVFKDNRFGFFSIAGIATVPINGTTSYGAWNIHGGVEFQKLGTTTEAFNGSDHRTIVSAGFGVTY
jgi:hypothetical protein